MSAAQANPHTQPMIFLARAGKVSGPFTEAQFEKMEAKGETSHFSWFWKTSAPGWKPLDPAPSFNPEQVAGSHAGKQHAPAAPVSASRVEVICHDFVNTVSGRLHDMSDLNCELLSDHDSAEPLFCVRSKVVLNLLDPQSGASMNVQARITAVTRRGAHWVYRIRWATTPALLAKGGEASAAA